MAWRRRERVGLRDSDDEQQFGRDDETRTTLEVEAPRAVRIECDTWAEGEQQGGKGGNEVMRVGDVVRCRECPDNCRRYGDSLVTSDFYWVGIVQEIGDDGFAQVGFEPTYDQRSRSVRLRIQRLVVIRRRGLRRSNKVALILPAPFVQDE